MQFHKISLYIGLLFFLITLSPVLAQAPVIYSIDKTSGTVNEIVTIQGQGFGNNATQVRVFFGAALADSILSITDTKIRVAVPSGATSSSISVINLTNYLTAYSSKMFTISYDGNDFEKVNLDGEYKFPTSGTDLYNLCFCDFNLDGLNDIATSDINAEKVTVLQNNSPDIHTVSFTPVEIDLDAKTRWVRCGDLNGDGLPDLVFSASNVNLNKEKIYIYKNISTPGGAIAFADKPVKNPVISYNVEGNLAARMDIKDLNGDGLPEIAVVDISSNGGVSIFKNTSTPGGAINFASTLITPFTTFNIPMVELSSIDLEDLNGDGLPELLAGKEEQNGVYVFTNASTSGNITFSSYIMLEAPGLTTNMKVGDLNGDDKPEVVVINSTYVGIFKNTTETNGVISFANHIRFDQTSLSREGLDMADMDGNGKLDIIVGSTTNRVIVLLNQSTQDILDFNTKKTLLVEENNISVRAGDLNGDGKPDLAYTARKTTGNDAIAVLINRNCVKPVLEPQAGLGVCDVLPYQLTVTQAIGVTYTWESSADGVTFVPVADATDSSFSYTTGTEAFYRVKVSSSHNGFSCLSVASNTVKVVRPEGFVPDKPTILDKNPVIPYCFGENIILKAESVNAQYHWTGPDGFTSHEQNPVIPHATAAKAGTYILYVQASAENGGCVSDTTRTIIQVSEPESIAIQSEDLPVFFEGDQATLRVEAFPGNTYSWKKNGQVIANATSHELTITEEGDYVAVIQNALGCTRESTPFTIAFARAAFPSEKCLNETVNFEITPASLAGQSIRYRWDFGDGSATQEGSQVSHQYNTVGSYTVTVDILTANGVSASRFEQTLTILDIPSINLTTTGIPNLCPGETVELIVEGDNAAYTWNTGQTENKITVTEAGIYHVTATNENGCTTTESMVVADADNPNAIIKANRERISLGDTLQLHASGGKAYLWNPAATLSDSTIANPIARPLVTTTYTCLIINEQGCQQTAEFTVQVDRALDVIAQRVFTPNNDGRHDTWYIEKMELYQDCHMTIFNRQGIKVYEAENYSNDNGWDGTFKGVPAPAGVYFFLINCGNEAGSQTGSVTIMR